MNYIILDMEWNQAFSKLKVIKKPVHLTGEIIQIGAVKLDEGFRYIDNFKIGIHPKYYTKMNKRVQKLTNITNADLRIGLPFKRAFELFKAWCGDDFVFLTWGFEDVPMLRDNMKLHRIDAEWLPDVYNLQIIYDTQVAHERQQSSLAKALEKVNEAPSPNAHDALGDAMSTYTVSTHLDMAEGIKSYQPDALSKASSKLAVEELQDTYSNKSEALCSRKELTFHCPQCGSKVSCGEIVPQNDVKKISLASCKNGHDFFVRFKLLKTKHNRIKVTRIIYTLTEDNLNYYNTKKHKKGTINEISIQA